MVLNGRKGLMIEDKAANMSRRAFLGLATMLVTAGTSGCGKQTETGSASLARQGKIDFKASFGSMKKTETTDGDDAAIFEITFTNESDETVSIGSAYIVDAFQNSTALVAAEVDRDLGQGLATVVEPGKETAVRLAYTLIDDSDVTVEVRKAYGSIDTEAEFAKTFSLT